MSDCRTSKRGTDSAHSCAYGGPNIAYAFYNESGAKTIPMEALLPGRVD